MITKIWRNNIYHIYQHKINNEYIIHIVNRNTGQLLMDWRVDREMSKSELTDYWNYWKEWQK